MLSRVRWDLIAFRPCECSESYCHVAPKAGVSSQVKVDMDPSILPSSVLTPAATAAYTTPPHDPTRAPAPTHGGARSEPAPGGTAPGPRMVPTCGAFSTPPATSSALPPGAPPNTAYPTHGPLPQMPGLAPPPLMYPPQQYPTPGIAYVPYHASTQVAHVLPSG